MNISMRQIIAIGRQSDRHNAFPELAPIIESDRREGLGWRYDGLGDWSTDAIFAKLQELGVDTSEGRFRAQTEAAGPPLVLYEGWEPRGGWRGDLWDDFSYLAAEELWNRLTPDLVCPEMIADRIDPVVESSYASDTPGESEVKSQEKMSAAMALMDYLERFPEEEREERYEEVCGCTICDYEGWLLDIICRCGAKYPDEITRIADIMSGFALNATNFQEDVAEELARAGRRDEARRRIRRNVERSPENIQTHIRAGDAYEVMGAVDEALGEFTAAAEIARDSKEWGWAADRMECFLQENGRGGEYNEFLRKHPRPTGKRGRRAPARSAAVSMPAAPESPPERVTQESSPPAAAAARQAYKTLKGRAMCPCGSGKRYGECCRKRR